MVIQYRDDERLASIGKDPGADPESRKTDDKEGDKNSVNKSGKENKSTKRKLL